MGYLLNAPHCRYDNDFVYAEGCASPDLPAPYRFQVQPGRVLPSVTASLGYSFGPEAPARTPTFKSPATAFWLSFTATVAPLATGVGMLVFSPKKRSDAYSLTAPGAIGAGLAIGPSVGHAYAGEFAAPAAWLWHARQD